MTEQGFFVLFAMFSVFIVLSYVGFIGWLFLVFNLRKNRQNLGDFEPSISLIVAFRNEENNLPSLLHSILEQNFSKSKMELVLVDDSSEDNGLILAQTFQKEHPELQLYIFELSKEMPGAYGKKEALSLAYSKATGDLILLTDADCILNKNNCLRRVLSFQNPKIKMVSAGVLISKTKGLFSQAQALENLSLMASTAGTTAAGLPILSNGANLAFDRRSFLELPENAIRKEENSGDDLFLLHAFKKHFGANSIAYEFDLEAAIYTPAQADLKTYFNQRIRWVSKSKSYKDIWIILVSLLVFGTNLSLVIASLASIFLPGYLLLCFFLFALKFSVDFILLFAVASWYKQKHLLRVYPLLQIIYPFFIVISAITGAFLSYEWKGRKYKSISKA